MKQEDSKTDDSKQAGKADWFFRLLGKKADAQQKEKALILFLLGVFFLLIASPVGTFTKSKTSQKNQNTESTDTEETNDSQKDAYIDKMENKLEQTIEGMEGAGKTRVMITLKDKGEKILDKNQPYESEKESSSEDGKTSDQTRTKSEQETVLVEQDGSTEPIVVRELYPDIEGVVVVCEGGGNDALSLQIREAVQALFSVDAHKIVVCQLRENTE